MDAVLSELLLEYELEPDVDEELSDSVSPIAIPQRLVGARA